MLRYFIVPLIVLLSVIAIQAQDEKKSVWDSSNFEGLEFRSLGPAFMSGRIADIAIDPNHENTWYVAVGSGGVWKTSNAGTSWTSVFDEQSCYSIGCVTIDHNNSNVIWVGTGENVGGRHVAYGDGIYKSNDGGKSWDNMGLEKSEHISKIIIHPDDSNTLWVAVQGPLWNKGGQRGIYKTTDGGDTWTQTLGDNLWVGATDILIDPRNPDVLYAATWQRHRTIAAYMGGGPGTAIYKSLDGGNNWEKLENGLPKSNMGKIGLAISPQQPDVIYAAIELNHRKGGVYKSTDRGANWVKQSDAVAGATGPHYYQELYACPHNFDRLYLVDNRMQISDNGGKTFRRMKETFKHGDNHSVTFKLDDPEYLLIGTDGGVYESFDLAETWRYIENLPVTQFYKIAVDDAEPFYNIYGGTQDNSTEGGPSRTDNVQGIQNSDWRVVLNWDGHQPATEPGNPDIIYAQRQEGTLSRIDMITGEVTDIRPEPGAEEDYERFNWDAPILVSPHDPKQIFFASQRLWRSDNRGDKWTAISPDLTRDQNRLELPIMGKKQSYDNAWDFLAMSNYNTITSIAESPKQKDLLYIGTDDGLIQISENGGGDWRKVDLSALPGVPKNAYVNDIKADLFDANVAYVAIDNHKNGDFKPYILKTSNKGASWKSIGSNLPDNHLVWRIVQDHENKDLLFIGTEFGIFFSTNSGGKWTQLKGNIPPIAIRDITIQRREDDLVAGSFGRGFFVLDDLSALRKTNENQLNEDASFLTARDAWWYIPKSHLSFDSKKGSQGDAHFVAPNPDFGALFTYYIGEESKSKTELRKEIEKKLTEENKDIPFPGWDEIYAEDSESKTSYFFEIINQKGDIIRRLNAPSKKGFNRLAWDLRHEAPKSITLDGKENGWQKGLLAIPGTYKAQLKKRTSSGTENIGDALEFNVTPLREGALKGSDYATLNTFWRAYESATVTNQAVQSSLGKLIKRATAIQTALQRSPMKTDDEIMSVKNIISQSKDLDKTLNGHPAKIQMGEKTKPSIGGRLFAIYRVISNSTYGPHENAKMNLNIVQEQLQSATNSINQNNKTLDEIIELIIANGGPWIEGEMIPTIKK